MIGFKDRRDVLSLESWKTSWQSRCMDRQASAARAQGQRMRGGQDVQSKMCRSRYNIRQAIKYVLQIE